MPGTKAHLFPVIPAITSSTQLYTQRQSSAASPANYRFTLADLMDFMAANNFLLVPSGSNVYLDNEDAALAGVEIGELYWLAPNNNYGTPVPPGGFLTRRNA